MARISMTGGLDAWLEKVGIKHPRILPIVRNQILLMLCAFFIGTATASESLWAMWFAAAFAVMTYIIFSWARFFLRSSLGSYSIAFLQAVLLHFFLRLVLLALGLYAALVYGEAPPLALLAGIATGTMSPLLTIIWGRFTKKS